METKSGLPHQFGISGGFRVTVTGAECIQVRPARASNPFMPCTARTALEGCSKPTNPNPRLSPVSSRAMG
eukprot:6307730-Amphidinium_carterae.1